MRIRGRCCGAIGLAPLVIAGAFPACQSNATSSALLGFGRSPHETPGNAARSEPAKSTRPPADREAQFPTVLDLVFDVVRVEFPSSDRHPSLKLWNHVDMMRVDAPRAASLVRNGLRVGVGAPGAWPAIQAIIESGGGEVRREALSVARGQPFALDLGPVSEGASVFAYDKSGRLKGRTFDEGRYVMQIDYAYHPDPARSLDVQIGFEIRNDHGTMTWEREGAVIRQVPAVDRHVFDEVTFRATLSRDEFLVVGPDANQAGAYLVGNRFFLHDRNGEPYESVLFLTPRIVETSASAAAQNGGE